MGIVRSCLALASLYQAKREFDKEKVEHNLNYLFWECTLKCNLSCRHCGSRCSPYLGRKDDLSGKEVQRIFQEIAEDFSDQDIMVAVTGGEPLVRDDIFKVMEEVAKLGFDWGMVTNGTLITENVIHQMEKSRMKTISVSIDGDSSSHAMLRGSEEVYYRAIKGLSLLLEHAKFLEAVEVITVVHAKNLHTLGSMYELLMKMGVEQWRLLRIDPIGRMKELEEGNLLLSGPQLQELLEFIVSKRAAGDMDVTFEESGFLGMEFEGRVRDHYFHCPAGISTGSILHDGAIGACPSLERHLVQGDAKAERFSEVWNIRFQQYRDRESTRRKGACAKCRWWAYCEGGSLHLWDWVEEEPRACHYQSMRTRSL